MKSVVTGGSVVGRWSLRVAGGALVVGPLVPLLLWGNPYPPAVWRYWALGTAGLALLALLLAARPAVTRRLPLARVAETVSGWGAPRVACSVALMASGLAGWFAWRVFRFGASTTDELAQLWHARILLEGRWALPVDAHRAFFALDTVVDGPAWFSQFPIGGPLLLALGTLVGAPWLTNTLLTGASAAALYGFARQAYPEREARVAALVFALAPSITLMGGTLMNHTPVLCLWTLVLWLLTRWEPAGTAPARHVHAAAIGITLGLMATVRPLDAVAAALATAGFQAAAFRRDRARLPEWLSQAAGGGLGVLPLVVAHLGTTGSPFRFAYELQWGAGHSIGFHEDPYGKPFTPLQGVEQALTYLGELAMFVTAFPVPSLLLAGATPWLLRRASRWDGLLVGHLALQLALHAAYWGRGEFLGPRFLFTALPTVVVLIARLPFAVADRVGPRWQPVVPLVFAAMLVSSWLAPPSALGVQGLMQIAARSRGALRADVAGAVEASGIDRGLVLLREPFSARLIRRLWGLGLRRDETAQLLATHDACAVHGVVQQFERAPRVDVNAARVLLLGTPRIVPSDTAMASTDGVLALNGPGSLADGCRSEFDADTTGGFVAFGVGLPHEPIDAAGRIDGPVVYAADLGPMNGQLAGRFGDRPWYRAVNRDGRVALERVPVPVPVPDAVSAPVSSGAPEAALRAPALAAPALAAPAVARRP